MSNHDDLIGELRCFNPTTGKSDGGYCVWEGGGKCLKCQAADALEELTNPEGKCPYCGSVNTTLHEEAAEIEHGQVGTIPYTALVCGCIDCGQQWTDYRDEDQRSEAVVNALQAKVAELTKPVDDEEIKAAIATCEHWHIPKAGKVIERLARVNFSNKKRLAGMAKIAMKDQAEIERLNNIVKSRQIRPKGKSVMGEMLVLREQRDQLQAAIDRLASDEDFTELQMQPGCDHTPTVDSVEHELETRLEYAKKFATKPEGE